MPRCNLLSNLVCMANITSEARPRCVFQHVMRLGTRRQEVHKSLNQSASFCLKMLLDNNDI